MKDIEQLPWKKMAQKIDFPLAEGERIIESFSTHWIKYVSPGILYALLLSTGIFLCVTGRGTPLFFMGLLLITCIHHWFFQRMLSEGMVDVIITDKRVIFLEDSLWLSDTMHEVQIERIRAVEAHKKGLAQNIFSYGTLWFDTGGSDQDEGVIPLVPNPHRKAKLLAELIDQK